MAKSIDTQSRWKQLQAAAAKKNAPAVAKLKVVQDQYNKLVSEGKAK